MNTKFKQTEYFKYLSTNLAEMESERIEFNDRIIALLNNKTDELGTILKCHLIIEHYLDEFLITAYPTVSNLEKIRLTFNQKLELICNSHSLLKLTYTSVKCLNSLRNKFSHRLAYEIKEEDYKEIKDLMTIWYGAAGEPIPVGLQLIEHYTIWICANFNTMIKGIKKETPELGLTGYLIWLEKMTENK